MFVEYLQEGSEDCPLLRIYGNELAEFELLRMNLRQLSDSAAQFFCVHLIPGFRSIAGETLVACRADQDHGLVARSAKDFDWLLTMDGWHLVDDLIASLATSASNGKYQWLVGPNAPDGLEVGEISLLLSFTADGRW